jgi:predicted transcriptional regulator of viral defense system
MKKLIDKIKEIPKNYFSLNDIRKVSDLEEGSIKVGVNRLVKASKLFKLSHGYYSLDNSKVDFEKLAVEIYKPSYLSFELVLAKYGVLNQKPVHLTLATTKRAKTVKTEKGNIIYRHLRSNLFWGYIKDGDILIARVEKAFLDLAYLSLNGYAKFDIEEMNLDLLNMTLLKKYLKKFNSRRLNELILSRVI